MSAYGDCVVCNRPIDAATSERDLYREVTGLTKHRQAGGDNAIRLRRTTGRFAHSGCVALTTAGIDTDQTTLV